jgi:hypothetical protein
MAARSKGKRQWLLVLIIQQRRRKRRNRSFREVRCPRWPRFRRDRTQDGDGNYISNDVDITSTFKAVFDMENIEVGFSKFGAGAAPEHLLVRLGDPMPHKPADTGFKQGAAS